MTPQKLSRHSRRLVSKADKQRAIVNAIATAFDEGVTKDYFDAKLDAFDAKLVVFDVKLDAFKSQLSLHIYLMAGLIVAGSKLLDYLGV